MKKNVKFYLTEYQLLKKIRSDTWEKARPNGDRKRGSLSRNQLSCLYNW